MAEKIMIVDDDPNTLRLLQHIMQSKGYQCVAVASGAEALEKVYAERPDLMILDVMMPGLSGLDVCKQIRSDPKISRLPIIMLSARAQVTEKVSGLEAGADEYLTKPITPLELVARVQALLASSRRWMEVETAQRQRTIGILGAKGGVGATTLTLNIAAALAQDKNDVIAVELCPRLGGFALQLKQQPAKGIANLLAQGTRITVRTLSDNLLGLPLGFRVLYGPQSPTEFADISADHTEGILDGLSNVGNYVIADLAGLCLAAAQRAARLCNYMILVVETEPVCVATAKTILDLLKSWGVKANQIGLVVVNRVPLASPMNWRAIRTQLECDIWGVVPYAADMQIAAQSAGTPLVVFQPSSAAAISMLEIARRLSAETITGLKPE